MDLINDKYVLAMWYSSNNFGDCLNHYLIKELSGKIPINTTDRTKPHYIVCGSILGEFTEASSIWGAGFFYDHQVLHFNIPVHAVRGELTRSQVKIDCPVGDPALLLPLLYNPTVEKKHTAGVIPHWSNVKRVIEMDFDARIIDPYQSTKDFINDILSCEYVFSESLHGLIVADTYGIPNRWVDLGADTGDGYKYMDYYSTTLDAPLLAAKKLNKSDCIIHRYKHDLQGLLNSCPFKK